MNNVCNFIVAVESTAEASSTASTEASALALASLLPASESPDPVVVVTNLDVKSIHHDYLGLYQNIYATRRYYYYSSNHILLCNAREI